MKYGFGRYVTAAHAQHSELRVMAKVSFPKVNAKEKRPLVAGKLETRADLLLV